MKSSTVEITEWYNSKGELIEQTIVYKRGKNYDYFEQLPKRAEKWLERVKKSANYTNESKVGNETRKIYRREVK